MLLNEDIEPPFVEAIRKGELNQVYKGNEEPGIAADPFLKPLFPHFRDFELAINGTYGTEGRAYHGVKHAIDMTEETTWVKQQFADLSAALKDAYAGELGKAAGGSELSKTERKWVADVKRAAFIAHDMSYVNVDGSVPGFNQNTEAYFVKGSLKPDVDNGAAEGVLAPKPTADDKVALMVDKVFGFKPGDKLTQQNGLNEYISALSMVKHLEEAHTRPLTKDGPHRKLTPEAFEYMTAVTAAIAATVPFRDQAAYDQLGTRVKETYAEFIATPDANPAKTRRRVDIINGVAAIVANQDVLSFTGKRLEHSLVEGESLTQRYNKMLPKPEYLLKRDEWASTAAQITHELQNAIRKDDLGSDFSDPRIAMNVANDLRYEESRRTVKNAIAEGQPGKCKPNDFHFAAWKRSRVGIVAEGKLYHFARIGEGVRAQAFPPEGVVEAMNRTAFDKETHKGVGDIIKVASNAHNVALALLRTLAQQDPGSRDKNLEQLTEAFQANPDKLYESVKATPPEKMDERNVIAGKLLRQREHDNGLDKKKSPIAATLVSTLKPDEIEVLYHLAEKCYGVDAPPFSGKSPNVPAGKVDGKYDEAKGAESFMAGLEMLREKGITPKLDGMIAYMQEQLAGPKEGKAVKPSAAIY